MLVRTALKELWRQRLKDAELRLVFARDYLKYIQREVPLGEIRNADGEYAYQQAYRAEIRALGEFKRVLRIYTDLLVHGKLPDEG